MASGGRLLYEMLHHLQAASQFPVITIRKTFQVYIHGIREGQHFIQDLTAYAPIGHNHIFHPGPPHKAGRIPDKLPSYHGLIVGIGHAYIPPGSKVRGLFRQLFWGHRDNPAVRLTCHGYLMVLAEGTF